MVLFIYLVNENFVEIVLKVIESLDGSVRLGDIKIYLCS